MHGRATPPALRLLRKMKTASRMPVAMLSLTLAIWLLLWPARVAAMVVPSRGLAQVLGRDRGIEGSIPQLDARRRGQAARLADAVELATRHTPFRHPCLAQALVCHFILWLIRTRHPVFFGVRRADSGEKMEAHAWVMAGDIAVCGGRDRGEYTVVRCYVNA